MANNAVYTGAAMNFLQGYATSAFNTSKGYLDSLYSYVSESITMTPPTVDVPDPAQSITVDPDLNDARPTAPEDSEYPTRPTEPTMQNFDFPESPDYTIPDAPTLTEITIPEFIDGTIVGISSSLPIMGFDVPSVAEISTTAATEDSLIQTIRSRLESNVLNGGTMLNPLVEADIWNRDLERHDQALQDAVDKVTSQWAKFGFDAPDGLLAGSIIALNNEHMNKRLDRSREISVKQAELEQTGLFKSLELGISLENILMTSQNEYAKRVLEAAKATADVTIEIFKQRVAQYNALLDAFKTDAAVYKTTIEAEMARVEAYRARIMGLQAIAGIDETRVKIYTAKMAGLEQLVNIYNTEVKTVAAKYEAEKQKIDRYKVQVEAYAATIDGITKKYLGEVDGYKAYIQSWVAASDSQTKLIDVKARTEMAELEATIKEWEIQLKLIQEATNVKLEALKTVAQVSSNLAAGALSAIHASVSDSYQNSYQTYNNISTT
jgi:hypothetical protein